MQHSLRVELTRIALLGIALLVIGYFNGQTALTLLVGGSLYMVWTLLKIRRLYRWLEDGAKGLPPEASGVWGGISDQLYRLQKRNTRAKTNFRALVKRTRRITSALDEGLVILDAENCLDWWNPAAAELLGLREDALNEPITNMIRSPLFVSYIHQAEFKTPVELTLPGRSQRVLQFSAKKFSPTETALIVRDVTRIRNLEQMRKDFVANISHELRTPLTVLTGYLETLRGDGQTPVPKTWTNALSQMEDQVARMNLLTEDLMMLSRLESTNPSPHSDIDLMVLITPIVESARALSQDKHRITVKPMARATLRGDPKELHSAFSNLIYNAVKHNPEGCDICIEIDHSETGPVVTVRDNGIGIDSKHLPRLTERFYRPDSGRSTEMGGTGLGLAIVKHVLSRHHASLTIDSELGKGASFSCRFEAI